MSSFFLSERFFPNVFHYVMVIDVSWHTLETLLRSPHVREGGFPNPGSFVCEIWNPGLCNPEYSSRNPESGIPLTIEIQNLSSSD